MGTTNFYFPHRDATNEQRLIEDLVVESIKIYGHDIMYLPRTVVNQGAVIRDDQYSEFHNAYQVEVYIKTVEGFEGQGDYLSKFGLEIRDQMTLTISRRSFGEEITKKDPSIIRPREGDVIYFPLNKKFYELKFVEHEAVFYQLGSLQSYDITVELFTYGQETFATGIPEIDVPFAMLERTLDANGVPQNVRTIEAGGEIVVGNDGVPIVITIPTLDPQTGDEEARNEEIQAEANVFIDFSETDPFSEGGHY